MKIVLMLGDITQCEAPVIVNAANKELLPGGGVCGAIYNAAGLHSLLDYQYCNHIDDCETGDAVVTPGFKLCEQIIHAVGPIYNNHTPEDAKKLLASAYLNSLKKFVPLGYDKIAFPLISTGIYGYPKEEAIQIAVQTVKEFEHDGTVLFVCFFEEDYNLVFEQLALYEDNYKTNRA